MSGARAAWLGGDRSDAIDLWLSAYDLTAKFPQNDPRRAASLDTLATCEDTPMRLQDALDAWDRCETWVKHMDMTPGARSSTFHLRLESCHPGTYPRVGRLHCHRMLAAGRAGTMARRAALDGDIENMRTALNQRRDAFGHRESDAAAMAAWLREPIAETPVHRFADLPPKQRDDTARLYGATLLAPVILDRNVGNDAQHT